MAKAAKRSARTAPRPKAPGAASRRGADAAEPMRSLGNLIRSARKEAGLTLQEVAGATGLSISYLSQIERNLLTPAVGALRRIADVLHVPAGTLVFAREPRGSSNFVTVIRDGEHRRYSFPQSSVDYQLLTPDLRRRSSLLRIVAEPGAESGPAMTHEGEDVVFVLKGRLVVEVADVRHELEVGDSMCFNSELPHRWFNDAEETAETIWMSTPPAF